MFIVCIFASSAFALIGENTKQIEARYGKPHQPLGEHHSLHVIGYNFRGFLVGVGFLNGISKREGFGRSGLPQLSLGDIQNILGFSAPKGTTWTRLEGKALGAIVPKGEERYWIRSDRKVLATLSAKGNFVMVQDRAFADQLNNR
jgi:hypothetical protein